MFYPIRFVYDERYTITLPKMDVHPIIHHLSSRYRSIMDELEKLDVALSMYSPDELDLTIIESITTSDYRHILKDPGNIVKCFYKVEDNQSEIALAVLESMGWMVMGTLKAAQLSYSQGGLTISIGGGFHHARKDRCGGFSIYNDYLAAAQWIWEKNSTKRILYIDLDAHFGDGVLKELGTDKRFYHYDVFNTFTSEYVNRTTDRSRIYGIPNQSVDTVYIGVVVETLEKMIDDVCPDFIFYNAGSDPLFGDELGGLKLSARGLKLRDQYVFEAIRKRNVPSIMTLSGGYTKRSVYAVARSIQNLMTINQPLNN